MRQWTRLIALVTVLLGITVEARPQEMATLHGLIHDELGAAVARAFVLVHGGPRAINQELKLNEKAEFEVRLPPGTYDVFVGSAGFVPYAKAVQVWKDKPVTLRIKLKVDKEHLED